MTEVAPGPGFATGSCGCGCECHMGLEPRERFLEKDTDRGG